MALNLMTILAFASIVMTYFGVNFYLVGLHSYASGDKVITTSLFIESFYRICSSNQYRDINLSDISRNNF